MDLSSLIPTPVVPIASEAATFQKRSEDSEPDQQVEQLLPFLGMDQPPDEFPEVDVVRLVIDASSIVIGNMMASIHRVIGDATSVDSLLDTPISLMVGGLIRDTVARCVSHPIGDERRCVIRDVVAYLVGGTIRLCGISFGGQDGHWEQGSHQQRNHRCRQFVFEHMVSFLTIETPRTAVIPRSFGKFFPLSDPPCHDAGPLLPTGTA